MKLNWSQITIGIFSLSCGLLFYIFNRNPNDVCLLSVFFDDTYKGFRHVISIPTFIEYSLPTFFHSFSFILITSSLFPFNKRIYLFVCSIWLSIEVLFEFGQKLVLKSLNNSLTDIFVWIPFSEEISGYFTRGTFDYIDLVSIFIATIIAYFVLLITGRQEDYSNGKC